MFQSGMGDWRVRDAARMPDPMNAKDINSMGEDVAVIEIIVLAVLLAFIVFKLRSVLGRRTGHEQQQRNGIFLPRKTEDPNARQGDNDDQVVALPRRTGPVEAQPSAEERIGAFAPAGSPLAQGLMDIQLADRSFEPEGFVNGAKSAYEMIVTAFAAGDRKALRPLLSKDVMGDFDSAITDRESRGETMEFTFVGLNSAKMTEAALIDKIAEVTVRFVSEVISVKKNADGAVIEGDPSHMRLVTDVWTFARDTRSSDPNWELVATAG